MSKKKKITVQITTKSIHGINTFNAKVIYNRKNTNFNLWDKESIDIAEENPEIYYPFAEEKVRRAVALFIEYEKDKFHLKGFRGCFEFCYEDINNQYPYDNLQLLRTELGDMLTYNEFRSIPDKYVVTNEFRPNLPSYYEEYEDGYDIISKIVEADRTYKVKVVSSLSDKAKCIFILGLLIKEYSTNTKKSNLIDWYSAATIDDFREFFKKNSLIYIKKWKLDIQPNFFSILTQSLSKWLKQASDTRYADPFKE